MDGSAITHLPAFRAPATTGQELSLDTFLQKVPLAIVFLAGIEEDAELLRAFDEALPRFGAERAQLLVVAPLSHRPGGVAAARNLGVAASTSPVVAFCDDDSRWGTWGSRSCPDRLCRVRPPGSGIGPHPGRCGSAS